MPDGVYEHFEEGLGGHGAATRSEWREQFQAYGALYPEIAAEIEQLPRRELPPGSDRNPPVFPAGEGTSRERIGV